MKDEMKVKLVKEGLNAAIIVTMILSLVFLTVRGY